MRCCGNPYQQITVRAGADALALVRCARCGDQEWVQDGAAVPRGVAFELLASAYREVPLRARVSREAAAARSAARREERSAALTVTLPTGAANEVDSAKLAGLLEGWQVLGASA